MVETPTSPEVAQASASEGTLAAMGAELRKLGTHSAHYLAGMAGTMLLGLISFPIFTRVFSVAEFGAIDLAQKVLLFLTAGSKMGLQNAALRFFDGEAPGRNGQGTPRYYSTMFFGVLLTATAAALLFIPVGRYLPQQFTGPEFANLYLLLAALIVVRALTSILCAFLRVEERTTAFNVVSVGTKGLTILAVCALLPFYPRTAPTYFTATVAVEAAIVLVLTASLVQRGALQPAAFDRSLFRMGAAFGVPLVVYESAFNILGSADRFLVQDYLGAEALGFYSVAYGLAQTANDFLITPLNLALMPIYMRIWSTSGREATIRFLTVSLDYYILAAAGILAVAAASAEDLVRFLASSKYAGADRLIPVLLAGLLAYTAHLFLAAGLLLHKQTMKLAGMLALCAVLNIGLNCLLLPVIGLMGGAIATLISYFACVIALGLASHGLMPLEIRPGSLAKYAAAGIAGWLAASAVHPSTTGVSLVVKSTVAMGVYLGLLSLLDARIRRAATACRRLLGY